MKKRIVLIIISFLACMIESVAPAFAALDPLPARNAPNNFRDRYQTDAFTGSGTYSYPIKVPKGTNGLTPDVSFSYNSAGTRDLSLRSGAGWQLGQDYVERDINFTTDGGQTSDDKFKLHLKGSMYDLVYVASEGRYHTKIESNIKVAY